MEKDSFFREDSFFEGDTLFGVNPFSGKNFLWSRNYFQGSHCIRETYSSGQSLFFGGSHFFRARYFFEKALFVCLFVVGRERGPCSGTCELRRFAHCALLCFLFFLMDESPHSPHAPSREHPRHLLLMLTSPHRPGATTHDSDASKAGARDHLSSVPRTSRSVSSVQLGTLLLPFSCIPVECCPSLTLCL